MNNKNKKRIVDIFKNRKVFGTALGIVFYLFCIFFFTYAFYSWRSSNTDVVIGINDSSAEVEFENDGNINATNIGPVLDYREGVSGGFTALNDTRKDIEINIRLQILTISDNLKNNTFKYLLVRDLNGGNNYDYENPVASGDFTELNVGINLLFIDTLPAGKKYSYKLYVYIDGNVENDINLQDNSMTSVLSIKDYTELAEIVPGSYVAYTGNNGCVNEYCSGGENLWRVAYIDGGNAYLISSIA